MRQKTLIEYYIGQQTEKDKSKKEGAIDSIRFGMIHKIIHASEKDGIMEKGHHQGLLCGPQKKEDTFKE